MKKRTKQKSEGDADASVRPLKLSRQPRGRDIPAGTLGQEIAGLRIFQHFLDQVGVDENALIAMNQARQRGVISDAKNFYSLLTAFSIHLQNSSSAKARSENKLLAKATVFGYFSQTVNFLRERYPQSLTDNKRIASIRDKMGSAIDERNLRANVKTNDAPGCTVDDLKALIDHQVGQRFDGFKSVHDAAVLVMMWHTFGRAIDTCFARKQQLSIASSGELFLKVARLKTSVVHGLSIFKTAQDWQLCALHALGMLFVCTTEPSEYVFPLIPRTVESEIPGGVTRTQEEGVLFWESLETATADERPQGARSRPNVSKYVNDVINSVYKSRSKSYMTPGLTSHSIRRGAAAFANGNSKLAIQWISTRGAWLLDSLTKVFAYIGTTTREDQCVGKVLAGYEDPTAPVVTPTFGLLLQRLAAHEQRQAITLKRELFRNVHGFDDLKLNVSDAVLDAALAALLIHLDQVIQHLRVVSNEPTLYERRINECLVLATDCDGHPLTLRQVCTWGETLRNLWRESNYVQLGALASNAEPAIVKIMQQLLSKTEALEKAVTQLVATHASSAAHSVAAHSDVVVSRQSVFAQPETASLAGAFFAWYTTHLWQPGSTRKDQSVRCEYKAAVNIMIALFSEPVLIPPEPPRESVSAYDGWKHQVWTLAQSMDTNANAVLSRIDARRVTKQPAALRKRWARIRTSHSARYGDLVDAHLRRLNAGTILDHCTPPSHIWTAKDFSPI